MSEIVQSLFGVSPESYQRQQQQQADAQALAFSRLDPFQQASFNIQRGANMLGGAIGGALGGQDPELQRRTQAQQIMGMIDPANPDTFFRAAEMAIQGGDQQLALGLRLEGEKYKQQALIRGDEALQRSDAALQRTDAAQQRADAAAKRTRDAEALRQQQLAQGIGQDAFVPGQEVYGEDIMGQQVGAGMFAPSFDLQRVQSQLMAMGPAGQAELQRLVAAQKLTRPEEIKVGATDRVLRRGDDGTLKEVVSAAPPQPGTTTRQLTTAEARSRGLPADKPYQIDSTGKVSQIGGGGVTVYTGKEQESQFEKGLGDKQSERVNKSFETAQDAALILETNNVGRNLLKSGAITGTGADFFVGFNNALAQAGIDFGFADAAANSQAYAAAMGANVGRLIKQFGAGTGLSDADREYAEKMAGGKIALTKAALTRILDINDKAANRVIDRHNKMVAPIKTNLSFAVEKPTSNQPPPSSASQIPAAAPATPARATSLRETPANVTTNPNFPGFSTPRRP